MHISSKIFIFGVPGSEKTSVSRQLHLQLDYPLVEADCLRVSAQREQAEPEAPFLYIGTTEAYRHFGNLTLENVIKGLYAVRLSLAPYVSRAAQAYPETLLMEAAFLDPHHLQSVGSMVLVITEAVEQHKRQFFAFRQRTEQAYAAFGAVRLLQSYLIDEAQTHGFLIVNNQGDIQTVVEQFRGRQ